MKKGLPFSKLLERIGDRLLAISDTYAARNNYGRRFRFFFLLGDWFLNRSI